MMRDANRAIGLMRSETYVTSPNTKKPAPSVGSEVMKTPREKLAAIS